MSNVQDAGVFVHNNRQYTVFIHFDEDTWQIAKIEIRFGACQICIFELSDFDPEDPLQVNAITIAKMEYDRERDDDLIEGEWPDQPWPRHYFLTDEGGSECH